jgi:tetratricopeptide (TPR) repeat protein
MNFDEVVKDLHTRHMALVGRWDVKEEEWKALETEYDRWVNKFPDHPAIIFQYGMLLLQRERRGLAIACFERCITCGAIGSAPYINLGAAYKVNHNDAKAREYYHLAIKEAEKHPNINARGVNEDLSFAYHGMGSLYVNAGEPDMAIFWADKALKVDPEDRHATWNKGLALLEKGQWAEGFDIYDSAGVLASTLAKSERKIKTYGGLPKWDGTKGKTVICYGEQGIGDEVMFASMVPDLLKDTKVILDCDKRLKSLFERSFPGVEAVYPTSGIDDPFPWIKDHKVDAYMPMGSLGKHYRRKKEDFPKTPFFVTDPQKDAYWKFHLEELPKGLNVGISWAGGLKKTRFDQRTIVPKMWADVLKVKNVNFISLQYHPWAADECAMMGREYGAPIYHWGDAVEDYDHTASLVKNLDLVITVNTSLHHLSGALGAKQWCLTPVMCAWRYGVSGPSPWYGNCEMIRQKKAGDWKPVMADVAKRLAGLAA